MSLGVHSEDPGRSLGIHYEGPGRSMYALAGCASILVFVVLMTLGPQRCVILWYFYMYSPQARQRYWYQRAVSAQSQKWGVHCLASWGDWEDPGEAGGRFDPC